MQNNRTVPSLGHMKSFEHLRAAWLDARRDPSGTNFRKRRFRIVHDIIKAIVDRKGRCCVIDVGGTPSYWNHYLDEIGDAPIEVTIVNLRPENTQLPDERFSFQAGNACNLSQFRDQQFDLVHSNSVIEHVGRWKNMADMAREVRRLAPAYFVQTPNFWFPFEPHFRTPFFHWLPEQWRVRLLMSRDLGFYKRSQDIDAAMAAMEGAVLVDQRQFQALFPDAQIIREKFFGLTKSLMAVRTPPN